MGSLRCFFFQAEDGIRDYKVTGVQTCALPICGGRVSGERGHRGGRRPTPARGRKATALPGPGEVAAAIHARSVTLSSERLHAIAKMDLVEAEGGRATPVDYKHGSPREGPDGLELWPSDKAQLAVQGIVLRDNGYQCEEGVVYYRKTGQRVRVALDEALVAETEALIAQAWAVAERGEIPPPLVDSPKCPG